MTHTLPPQICAHIVLTILTNHQPDQNKKSVLEERAALHAKLTGGNGGAGDGAGDGAALAAADRLAVLEGLARNLKKEHTLRLMLNCFFYNRCGFFWIGSGLVEWAAARLLLSALCCHCHSAMLTHTHLKKH
jgi:hypothetical protein